MLGNWLRSLPAPPALARWLPGTSGHFGPPRRFGLIRDLVPVRGGDVVTVSPAAELPPIRAIWHGSAAVSKFENFHPAVPALNVFALADARLLGPEGFIVTRDDRFVYDTGYWSRLHPTPVLQHPLYRRKRARPTLRLPGLCVSLATDFAAGSFGHFLHDGLSRWPLVLKSRWDLSKVNWIFCPRPESPATAALCRLLPVPPERVLNCSREHDYEAEQLIATSFPGEPGNVTPDTALFLRGLGDAWRQPDPPRGRIFLARRGRKRDLLNSAETEAAFSEFGFSILDPATDPSVLAACANAAVIAGIDGSNMANIAFAPAGSRVLVIYPSRPPSLPYNLTLAISGGRELHIIQGTPPTSEDPDYQGGFFLAPAELRACLKDICADLP